jgi:hypothetical protein
LRRSSTVVAARGGATQWCGGWRSEEGSRTVHSGRGSKRSSAVVAARGGAAQSRRSSKVVGAAQWWRLEEEQRSGGGSRRSSAVVKVEVTDGAALWKKRLQNSGNDLSLVGTRGGALADYRIVGMISLS